MRELLLGIDLGTSAVKASLFDRAGGWIASHSSAYPTERPHPGYAEQEPARWWSAVVQSVQLLLQGGVAPESVKAIGLSGQMHGAVLLYGDGSWSNGVIWRDRRSAAQAQAIRDEVGNARLIELAGSPIAAGFQAATMRWYAENVADACAEVQHILLPKDWLGWRLAGVAATDPSDAAGTLLQDIHTGQWSEELAAAARVDPALLPPIAKSSSLRGGLSQAAARELDLRSGTPVVIGGADTPCALLAAGAVDEGTLLLNLSTGGQLVQPLSSAVVDLSGRLHTFRSALDADAGAGWYLMGATLAAGYALHWWREQIAGSVPSTYDALLASAAQIAPGCDGLIFLPYLAGERTPHMDPQARGAFLGLRDHHTQAHMTRAVLEGATFATWEAFLTMREIAPAPAEITLAGGGARSALWRQIVADIFGLPVRALAMPEQSAWGAALLAGEGIGWWQASAQAVACAQRSGVTLPRPDVVERYAARFQLFQEAFRANRSLFHLLT